MAQSFPRLEAAVAELRERPIAGTEKGFGVPPPGVTVSAASLGASRPSLFGPGFTMPVLVLRESGLAHNIDAMAAYCTASGVRLAPHGKTTMAPQLFARQLSAGAWAITAATAGELHVYRAFGIPRVLLANELTDPAGAAWLAGELAADPDFECYVYADSLPGVRLLDEAVRRASPARPLPVLVELGYPGGRTGCRDLAAAEAVARAVAQAGSLRLAGVAGYEGGIGRDRSPQSIGKVAAYCRELRSLGERLAATGLAVDELILSAGQPQRAGLRHGERDRLGCGQVAAPRAAPGVAEFHQHRQRPVRAGLPHGLVKQPDAGQTVGVHVTVEARVGGQLTRQPGSPGGVGQLVGEQHPRNAERPVHVQLPDRRRGDRPRAGGELLSEQLRRHGRFAVRCEPYPRRRAIGRHGGDVVGDGGLPQHQHRHGEAGPEQGRAPRTKAGGAHHGTGSRDAEPFLGPGNRPLPQLRDRRLETGGKRLRHHCVPWVGVGWDVTRK